MPDSNVCKPWSKWVYFVLEHVTFLVALLLLVPPVPSDAGHQYRFWPLVPIITVVFGVSRFLAKKQGLETWRGAVVKTMCLLAAGYMMYLRVHSFMGVR